MSFCAQASTKLSVMLGSSLLPESGTPYSIVVTALVPTLGGEGAGLLVEYVGVNSCTRSLFKSAAYRLPEEVTPTPSTPLNWPSPSPEPPTLAKNVPTWLNSCTRLLPLSATNRSPETGSVAISPGFENWPLPDPAAPNCPT